MKRRAVDAWGVRHEKWLVGALMLWPIARQLGDLRRHFDCDEMYTFFLSSLGKFDDLMRAIPADGNPPLYYLIAGPSLRLFGASEPATRLPAVLAFFVASLCLYVFVRRRCPVSSALFALLAFDVSLAAGDYATMARPYSLLLAFTGIALVSWQRAAERTSDRALALAGVGIGVAGAVLSHHFGALHVAVPLVLGEAWRLAQRRRLDMPMYAAGLAGASMLLVTVPLMQQTYAAFLMHVKGSAAFVYRPQVDGLADYWQMVDPTLLFAFMAAVIVAGLLFRKRDAPTDTEHIPPREIAAAAGLAALLPIVLALAWSITGYFQARYAIGSSIGISILFGFLSSGRMRVSRAGPVTIPICFAGLALLYAAQEVREKVAMWRGRYMEAPIVDQQAASVLDTAPTDRPIVVASAGEYHVIWWYSPAERRQQLRYLSDPAYAVTQREPIGELTLLAEQPFIPSKVDDYRQFLTAHREFYLHCRNAGGVACSDETSWMKDRLTSEGHTLTPVAATAKDTLYRVLLK